MSTLRTMSPLVPAIVFSLLIGGIGGYCVRAYSPAQASTPVANTSGGGGGGEGGFGGMGGGGMRGMGGPPPAGMALSRLVRNLSIIEEVQNQGLTPQQAQTVLPVLKSLQSADKLPAQEAQSKMDVIEKTLTDSQKHALDDLQPQRGGGGGGRGGQGGGGRGGMGGGGGMSGGMMGGMGGGRPDPEHPFASERSKKSLDDLIASLQSPSK
ncbi:MAG TPA: hypothetical protein VFA07_02505 [Chthonomonadaceae bacterium]|nr:hypothetical protein [Chthonomonadaceae bacterium]